MSSQAITFEAPEEFIAAIDGIASDREVDRAEILRDALAGYIADYQDLQADLEEAERQFEAGETVSHEEVVAWFRDQHPELHESEAA